MPQFTTPQPTLHLPKPPSTARPNNTQPTTTFAAPVYYTEKPKYFSAPSNYRTRLLLTTPPMPRSFTVQSTLPPSSPPTLLGSQELHNPSYYLGCSDILHQSYEVFHCPELLHNKGT
ncbi:hypothetical protein DAPPUDRAFT_235739 [Daphnia pulex]|uniref:Uncharacterized protein n=1 Tax=Daphnia pulex TaxID=6669 RepID=E9G0P9_DAPPU|nr:hypothetical protein DAPPUDRAFT_235739 [Daphnia pulex]|eukprot:EFX87364.1 hypothetical protein DAPPUDRAFT_235739 [Daphnia pulex]